MKTRLLVFVAAMVLVHRTAAAQQQATDDAVGYEVHPPTPSPTAAPPAVVPPSPFLSPQGSVLLAPPAVALAVPVAPGASPAGQWVFTQQYGWVWMPFGRKYTVQPLADGGDPYMYIYYPDYGWNWLAAPWVFGIGPAPYFGEGGTERYRWYGTGLSGHPWWGHRDGSPAGYRGVVASNPAWAARQTHAYTRVVSRDRVGAGHLVVPQSRTTPAEVARSAPEHAYMTRPAPSAIEHARGE